MDGINTKQSVSLSAGKAMNNVSSLLHVAVCWPETGQEECLN